jgi:Cu+-exporting ATPase
VVKTEAARTDQATLTIPVIGMSCAACQSHVERSLRRTPGVGGAEVNLMTRSARIIFDPTVAKPENLVDAVRHSGYESSLPPDENTRGSHIHPSDPTDGSVRNRAIATLVMAAAAMLLSMPVAMPQTHATTGSVGVFSQAAMHLLPFLYRIPVRTLEFLLLALTIAGMVLAVSEVYKPAWSALRHRTTNMNTLVALGTMAALLYSVVATLTPSLFLSHGLHPDVYYESVLFILAFLMTGRWLEARARERTQGALHALADLQPQTVTILQDGREVELPLASVQADDTIVLRPGERVPVDGVVLCGSGSVDESLLTGEWLPVPRGPGDRLIGGSLNYDGALEYRATSLGSSSVLGQMLRLVEQAQSSRAPTQQLADKVSAIFVPVVLGIALITFLAWLVLDHGNLGHAFAACVTVLVIACPCAMGLAVPAALTVAIGRGAQLGILFKNGEALERLAGIDTLVLDKTGTLTEGKPRISGIYPLPRWTAQDLLLLTASLEKRSEHPLARAVLDRAASEAGLTLQETSNVRAIPGKGITGSVGAKTIAAGNAALFEQLGIEVQPPPSESSDASTLLIAIDGSYAGYLTAQDQIRTGAAEAIRRMKSRHIGTVMLTGDSSSAAATVATETGIGAVFASLLPEQKLEHIRSLQAAGKRVAMVGDGINDAAALAQANAGIAMGTGTDLAREAGEIVLLRGEPLSIVTAIDLARATLRTMRENLGWALGYNIVGIPIAAGVLYPVFGILLSPAIASAAMALSSVSVLANSLRLRGFQGK